MQQIPTVYLVALVLAACSTATHSVSGDRRVYGLTPSELAAALVRPPNDPISAGSHPSSTDTANRLANAGAWAIEGHEEWCLGVRLLRASLQVGLKNPYLVSMVAGGFHLTAMSRDELRAWEYLTRRWPEILWARDERVRVAARLKAETPQETAAREAHEAECSR